MNHRTPRILGALSVTTALLTLVIAGPVGATAAPLVFAVDNLSPGTVSQGQLGAFHITASNPSTNTSNISQLYLTERSGATVYGITGNDRGACSVGSQLLCSFGALRPGDSLDFTVALVAPAGSTWHTDFEFSSTGYVIGKNKSHGDLFIQTYDISTPGSAADSAGTYVWDTSHQSFHNGLSLGNSNQQSTSVTVFDTTFPASAEDGLSLLTLTCSGSLHCPGTLFGQVSQITVDSGADHVIHVVLQFYKPGKNPNQVTGVYHQYTDSNNVVQEEPITTQCGATPVAPCFTATKLGGNNLQIDVWLTHNGKIAGF